MLVGFVGTIGSGKGTAGKILAERGFFTESFAAPLKDVVANLFGWRRDLLEGDTERSREFRETVDPWWSERFGRDITPRLMLQIVGTESMRMCIHDDFWIACLEKRIAERVKGGIDYVITDVRFPNEIDAIHRMGGKVIEIHRGDPPDWYYQAVMYNNKQTNIRPNKHHSEWAWMGYKIDYTITNNGSLEDLESDVVLMLESLEPEKSFLTSLETSV